MVPGDLALRDISHRRAPATVDLQDCILLGFLDNKCIFEESGFSILSLDRNFIRES